MANRQYVGARYVPKFYQGSNGNEWDSGVTYEPLTIVTYLNCSYTSKKPVPPRTVTPNLDTEYWVLTSSTNADILELKEVVGNETSGLVKDVNDLQTETASLDTRVDEIEETISKGFLLVGDSFGEGTNGWINLFKSFYPNYPAFSYAEGGIGYCGTGNITGLTIRYAVGQYLATLTEEQINSITDVIVVLGENDTQAEHVSNITSAVESFCIYLMQTLPNLQKAVFFYNGTYNIPTSNYGSRAQYKSGARNSILKAVTQYPNFSFSDNAQLALVNSGLTEADGVHPTTPLGYQMLTRAINDGYNNKQFVYYYNNTVSNINFKSGDYLCEISMPFNTTLYSGSALTLTAEAFTTIASNQALPVYPKAGQIWIIPLPAVIGNDNIVRTNLSLAFRDNGDIQIFNPGTAITLTSIRELLPINHQFNAID